MPPVPRSKGFHTQLLPTVSKSITGCAYRATEKNNNEANRNFFIAHSFRRIINKLIRNRM
jgi:hypothetical protein